MKLKRIWACILRKKYIFIALFCCVLLSLVAIVPSTRTSVRPKCKYTIVIDAGHGGLDVK